MKIIIRATEQQRQVLLHRNLPGYAEITWHTGNNIPEQGFDACFDFCFLQHLPSEWQTTGPVFVNATALTCDQLPTGYVRMNAWPGFWENGALEIAAAPAIKERAIAILETLNWQYIWSPDQPGMISARIVAMIINEAYFALFEGVSSKMEMDIAMKYGTNYPFGPFEWAEKIEVKEIYGLLTSMRATQERYIIAPALKAEAEKQDNF